MSSINPDKNNGQDASIDAYNGKVLLAAVICLSIVIFFVLLLHGYARWVLRRRPIVANVVTEPLHRRSLSTYPGYANELEVALPGNGVDAKVVASLPLFVYRSKEHENGLHCVVCLSVMVEDEIGRVLPKCKHRFHVECIDMWLMSHSTCPICRAPVRTDEPASVGDGAPLAVLVGVEEEPGSGDEEFSDLSGTVEGEVVVEMPVSSDESSTNSGSSSSSSSSASTSSSVGCSLKRMLSRSRSESRVFPSLPVN
ncbi:RING-H2 finger protein ATL2-like [Elaeis guineensis]|uniref:RING-H2 finger protein ATL63-like n=1 Tax=Elaeis guineensis var. tenera TaxID=51953 RepID=A0A6I9RC70_ELAGV|nr:RING-H2 finger protein ATL63-like [Elaeis guineensis]